MSSLKAGREASLAFFEHQFTFGIVSILATRQQPLWPRFQGLVSLLLIRRTKHGP